MLGLDERYIVYNENAGLADLRQFFDSALRCLYTVIASVKRQCAAKDAVPLATSTELNRSSRIELADEIFPAMSHQMATRQQIIERLNKRRRRTGVIECHATWNVFQVILRISLGGRAYFSPSRDGVPFRFGILKGKTFTGSVRCDSYFTTKKKFYG